MKALSIALVMGMFTSSIKPMTVQANTNTPNTSETTPTNENVVVVKVSAYDVDPTGYSDSGKGIYDALQEAKKISKLGQAVVLEFEENATYTIKKEFAQVREVHTSNTSSTDRSHRYINKHIAMLIEDIDNLTIEGNGAELILEGDMMALGIFQSENITIRNLSWDFHTPTTTEMTVFDFNRAAKTVDYFIPEYFHYEIIGNGIRWKSEQDSQGHYYWTANNEHDNYGISVKYPTEKMGRAYYPNQGPFQNVRNIQKLENGLLRITYNQFGIEPVKGMNYQLVANRWRPTSGALVWESKDVQIERVRISYMHGFGFLVQMSENVSFDGIRMETDPQTGKNTASYADGIHVAGAKGKISIKNSFFNNTHDDPINIHGTFTRVERRLDNHRLRLNYIHDQQGGFPQFYVGDKVVFYTRDTLESRDNETEYTVKSVEGPTRNNLKSMVVEFEEELPRYLSERIGSEPKFVAENVTYTPEVEIRNNQFINVFTRHILVTSRKKVVIDSNHFEAATMPANFFSNDSNDWYESGPIRNLEITNNVFKVKSIGRTWWKYAPAIYFYPVTKNSRLPRWENPVHKNILIQNNTFYLESDGALRAESVENLRFENNKIYRLNPNIQLQIQANDMFVDDSQTIQLNKEGNVVNGFKALPGGPEKNAGTTGNVLEFKASKNVVIRNNTYDDGLKQHVLIEDMPSSAYTIEDDLTTSTSRRDVVRPTQAIGEVQFVSTNPEVASFDAKGKLTAYQSGETEVYAYTIWNGTLVESNHQTVHVTAKASSPESLQVDQIVYLVDDSQNQLTLQQAGVSLEGVEFTSLNPDILQFENGQFTVLRTGIAEVLATHDAKTVKLVVAANHTASQQVRANHFAVENENDNITVETDSITILRNSREDLWQGDNNLNNLVRFSLDGKNAENFAAMITLDGLPLRQGNSWDSTYFILFKLNGNGTVDRDNYYSVGKRAHSNGFATVREEARRGSETQTNDVGENNKTLMTFVIEKQGETLNLYSYENQEFKLIHSDSNVAYLGNQLALGLGAWGNTQANRRLVASNFKLVEGTKENLVDAEAIPFKVADTSSSEISDIQINREENAAKAIVTATGANQLHTVVTDGKTTTIQTEQLNFDRTGDYKVYVINQSATGKLSQPYAIDYNVAGLTVNKTIHGVVLDQNLSLTIPASLTKLLYKQGATKEVIDITGLNQIEKEGYTIDLHRLASSKTKITNIETSLGNPSLDQDNQFLYTEQPDQYISITVGVSPETIKTEIYLPDHDVTYPVTAGEAVQIPIYNGVTSLEVISYAQDGQTKDVYRLHVLRNHKIKTGIASVVANEQEFSPSQNNFEVYSLEDFVVKANAIHAKVSYHVLEETDTTIRVRVKLQHEDKLSTEFKEYNLVKVEKVEADANYQAVDEALHAVPKNLASYTTESIERLQQAIQQVNRDKKASEQSVVDAYAQAILDAIEQLVLKAADYQYYNEVKTQVPSDLSVYTEDSVAVLEEALAVDVTNKTILQQEEVTQAANRIKQAIEELIFKLADYTVVAEAIKKAPTNLQIYTEESVAALQQAVGNVVFDKKITEQNEVDAYAQAILDAVNKLERKAITLEDNHVQVLIAKPSKDLPQDVQFRAEDAENTTTFASEDIVVYNLDLMHDGSVFESSDVRIVRFPVLAGRTVERLVHINQANELIDVPYKLVNGVVEMEIDHFSFYALIYKSQPKAVVVPVASTPAPVSSTQTNLPDTGVHSISPYFGIALVIAGIIIYRRKHS